MARFSNPELLNPEHQVSGFGSGEASLDRWLLRHARAAIGAGSARTYVVRDAEQERVVGYHALTVASTRHADATGRAVKGMPRHDIPAVLLARLAVDESVRKKGLGPFLLRDAMVRSVAVSEQAGIRLMLVHALNEGATKFYEHFGFEPSPTDPMNLQMILKDIRIAIDAMQ